MKLQALVLIVLCSVHLHSASARASQPATTSPTSDTPEPPDPGTSLAPPSDPASPDPCDLVLPEPVVAYAQLRCSDVW
jgi:hypothetical protein